MKILKNKLLWSFSLYAWLIALYILTSIAYSNKIDTGETLGIRWDYLEHFFLYLAIPIFYFLAEGAYLTKVIKNKYFILFLGLAFCSLTEVQQLYIEGRTYNPIDLVLNLIGFIAGIPIGKVLHRKLHTLIKS